MSVNIFDRAKVIDEAFIKAVKTSTLPDMSAMPNVSDHILADIFDTMLMNRHLDLMARRTKGRTFYSIGSSGHEGMCALALASRNTDMAFLHYRDATFCLQRRKAVTGSTPLYDMILSFAASSGDPVSGGRHKVLGGRDIMTSPQTSTIASHLPKAVGAWAAYQSSPMPIVFICEDNDIGISVRTPKGWIAANYANRPGLKYMACDGTDILDSLSTAREAVNFARERRKPVFLHMKMTRLMGHAGADIEAKYSSLGDIEDREASDPLMKTAAYILNAGFMSEDEILTQYEEMRARVARVAERVFTRPKLETAEDVMRPLTGGETRKASDTPSQDALAAIGCLRDGRKIPLNKMINKTLAEVMLTNDKALVFGEDVARKGGVYGVTLDLLKAFGPRRVQDTLLDEQTILGLAIGASQNGFLPIPEIQFLAYLHNAEDQIRGEAASLAFFSNGQFTNPMVIRIAGLGYQRGFGGHFHNDNSLTVLRDIPGLIVACPSNADDARRMFREVVRLAHVERRVCVFIEPIALYGTMDIQAEDKQWAGRYVPPQEDTLIALGDVHIHSDGEDIAILSYGNGYYLSRQAEDKLTMKARIIDMRWIKPLPIEAILKAIEPCKTILIVDECRGTGSLSEELTTALIEAGVKKPIARVVGHDSFIPLGNAAYAVMPSVDDIVAAAEALCG